MADIRITHSRVDGTEVHGSVKGDGVFQILRGTHGHWRARNGRMYLLQSRERPPKGHIINAGVAALEAAGHTVTVDIDRSARTVEQVAEAEAEREDRAGARAERFAGYAGSAQAAATAKFAQARQMAEAIPFGQPILVGHHSEGRDRRYRDRMNKTYERSFAEMDRAEHWERRAEAAESTQHYRKTIPVTLRRIEKLEADKRGIERAMAPRKDYHWDPDHGCTETHVVIYQAAGKRRERLQAELDDYQARIDYWRAEVAKAEEAGFVVWGPDKVAKGDYIRHRWGWAQVLRVNPKSVTIPWGADAVHLPVVTEENVRSATGGPGWTDKVTYDDITGRMSAGEMAAALAAGEVK